jgi:acyl transferase domain-containing protein
LLQDINGSSTSVFVGTVNSDFDDLISKVPTEYSPTGSIVASAAGKVAYKLNLKGPVMSLDTACSSSLTAIHMARQSLLNNECDYALAGGVSLMLTPKGHIGFSQLEVIATHGRCKTFSNDATGFGRGEGGGFVFLRRVADAVKDGNRILAIIKGSAVNHDGQSNGYTAPNQKAQEAVIASALQKAGVSPMEIGYIGKVKPQVSSNFFG